MKKFIICAALLVSGLTIGAYAQGSQAVNKQNTSVTVVSDTTGTSDDTNDEDAGTDAATDPASIQAQMDSAMQSAFKQADAGNSNDNGHGLWITQDYKGPRFVLLVLLIVFAFPVLLLAIILYFIYRNRKEKYELQKIAMEKGLNPNTPYYMDGRTAPNQPPYTTATKLPDYITPNEILWEKGIKQMCLGLGLALLLGFIVDEYLSTIGLLIFFMGLGKAIIAKTRKNSQNSTLNDKFNVNERHDTSAPQN